MRMRDYKLFDVEFTRLEHQRIEDSIGELTGYTRPERGPMRIARILAGSPGIAQAWLLNRWAMDQPEIINISESTIDVFIAEHGH